MAGLGIPLKRNRADFAVGLKINKALFLSRSHKASALAYAKAPVSSRKKICDCALLKTLHLFLALVFLLGTNLAFLSGCDAAGQALQGGADANTEGQTDGPPFSPVNPTDIVESPASISNIAQGYEIDDSTCAKGYISAAAISSSKLKLQITLEDMSYNYDLPSDGTTITCPLNMGDGSYTFAVWENTSGDRYALLGSSSVDVSMDSEFMPFIRPNYFCMYNESSSAVEKAAELVSDAQNEGDVIKNIYNWIVDNINYDIAKANSVASGYVPNPDDTLQSGTGICFDYASLAAAMLRSQGIPTKIITGYVSPDNIYHAWNMVYIDGRWETVSINILANSWTRIDTTFAAGDASSFVGDGTSYTNRYTY